MGFSSDALRRLGVRVEAQSQELPGPPFDFVCLLIEAILRTQHKGLRSISMESLIWTRVAQGLRAGSEIQQTAHNLP